MFRNRCQYLLNSYALSARSTKKYQIARNVVVVRYASIRITPDDQKTNTDFFKWILLAIPVTSFALGCWQVQRRKWKLNLIQTMKERLHAPSINMPENLKDLESMEYQPVLVRGRFLHDREFTIGPRAKINPNESETGTSFFKDTSNTLGFLVITPFKLSDRDDIILINRGWVHKNVKKQSLRPEGLIKDEVEFEGTVRLHEKRGQFMPKNNPQKEQWMYRDLEEMGRVYGASPVWLDAKGPNEVPGPAWPLPNQTRVFIRNEHTSYIITWFGLCGFTSWMWIRMFLQKLPLP